MRKRSSDRMDAGLCRTHSLRRRVSIPWKLLAQSGSTLLTVLSLPKEFLQRTLLALARLRHFQVVFRDLRSHPANGNGRDERMGVSPAQPGVTAGRTVPEDNLKMVQKIL